jgi:hypothetical protein
MGTGYHKALEEWEKSRRTLSLKEMQTVAAEACFEECKKLPVDQWFQHGTDPEQAIELAKESVRLWWEQPINKGSTIKVITESRNLVSAEEHYASDGVHGFIDGIYECDRELYVVDHKTASSMRRWTYSQEPNLEMAVYLTLAEEAKAQGLLPNKPVSFEYHVVSAKEGKTRLISCGYLTPELKQLLAQSLVEANAIVKHEAFRPNVEWNLCSPKYCAYFQGCRVDATLTPYTLPSYT